MGLMGSKFSTFEKTLPDVSGKVFVITGTTSGTGFVAAKTVAEHHGEVLLLNRPSSRSTASLEKLKAAVPDGKFVPIDCDLQDFISVRRACQEIKDEKQYTKIYCLSNNAGIMATPDEITGDGYEKQMQTNHLSHFLLTEELFPLLVRSAKEDGDARIVQHSSMARDMTPDNKGLEEQYFTKKEKDGMLGGDDISGGFMKGPQWLRYFQTKLANSVFNQCLHDRLTASKNEDCHKILAVCAHPGISATNLGDHLHEQAGYVMGAVSAAVGYFVSQSPEDGAMGLLKAMMDVRNNVAGGTMYGPKGLGGAAIVLPSKPHETDQAAKDMLWKTSEEATGVTFHIE